MKPVVLFPGWYVETANPAAHDTAWVLNEKCLRSFIRQEKEQLPVDDVKLISYHLSRYIRTQT